MPIYLHTRNARLRKAVHNASGRAEVIPREDVPTRADIVVTTAALTVSHERYAARMGTPWVVCLPEGSEWFMRRLEEMLTGCVVAGVDMAPYPPGKDTNNDSRTQTR